MPPSPARRRPRRPGGTVFPVVVGGVGGAGLAFLGGRRRRCEAAGCGDADCATTRCLICLENPDDYAPPGREVGMCFKCGQSFCGTCRPLLEQKLQKCPNCRASLFVPLSVSVQRLKDLIEARPRGRHVSKAMNNLGFMYEQGWGCDADQEVAVEWYAKAAERGLAQAQFNLGVAYETGVGVPVDRSKAADYYRRAAAQDDEAAKRALAHLARGPLVDLVAHLRFGRNGARRRKRPKSTTPMATRPQSAMPRSWRDRLATKFRHRVLRASSGA